MKASVQWVFVVVFVLGSIMFGMNKNVTTILKDQKDMIMRCETETKNLRTAMVLTSKDTWYYYGPGGIVSSEPNGKGQIVSFEMPTIFSIGEGGYGPSRPEDSTQAQLFNKQIKFKYNSGKDKEYAILGNLLAMRIVD